MSERIKGLVLVGILICLVIIAFKPAPQLNIQPAINLGDSIIQLGPNRIAIVETNINSGLYGTVLVFDFDDKTGTFNLVGKFNYKDYFRKPQKYGLVKEEKGNY
ncbi:hypothetical protein BBF96_15740 [Anoxybacter fermentans]|uniref:Uncharacterized protein n=1 Tax=Anoxybacter fermentans TaxID=1323375 RepID=A0A3Q9HSK9_9FIRM|nr:hypothetical protein [Anoxybacter fermentans]AZR74694.1 hypothetical protein BBF96_15740 [Anoxybacter fermentans]